MNNIIKKLSSRKLWAAVIADVTGIATLLTASQDDTVKCVASILLIICSTVAYISGESKIDAASATKVVLKATEDLIDVVDEYNKKE